MFRPYELFIGLRYTRAKRRNHFISVISLISILGIAVGVTALITVLSVMNGFQDDIRNSILGMASHVTISDNPGLADWRGLMAQVEHSPHVIGAAPYVERETMLSFGGRVSGAVLRGVDPAEEPRVSTVGGHMEYGKLTDLKSGTYGIILGNYLAGSLGVGPGDKVTVITPEVNPTPAGVLPRLRRFTVVGIFHVGNYQYDSSVALIDLGDAQRLFRLGREVTGLRLRLDDPYRAPAVASRLDDQLGGRYRIVDWTQRNANFFKAVATEKRVMFVILALIVAVAAFNIVSTLVMVVQDKQADIAILRTLGATPRSIMKIFVVQGVLIGIFGTLLGVVGGVALALNVPVIVPFIEHLFHVQFLSPQVYLISEVPSKLEWGDVHMIAGMSFLLCLLATLYPAWRGSRTQPAEALRYE